MIVCCKLSRCPYYGAIYCTNPLVSIDENGMCEQIWRRGNQRVRAFYPIEEKYKNHFKIVDAEISAKEKERFHQISIDEYLGGFDK